jgi:hypothetical protein
MAGPRLDPEVSAHLEWIGFVRPTGLVVSAPALVRAGAILDRRDAEGQQLLRAAVEERIVPGESDPVPWLPDFRAFASSVLGWSFSPKGFAGTPESPIPPELEIPLPDFGETLRPDFAVREPDPQPNGPAWQLLVSVVEPGLDLDHVSHGIGHYEASAHGRLERLLRQTGVPAGLLSNGRALRLLSAPYGESSGWIDFRVADMVQTAGRPICTALRLLLSQPRLLSLPRSQRLAGLLESSRKFQNEVSERLAEQVLHALYELLRGFQAAHDASRGKLLREPLAEHPNEIYRGLLTVILRLVFLFYAEERDLLPEDETFLQSYSLAGLHERLREDSALFPDMMDQRFGAWAQLLALFRMVFDGADWGSGRLPKRHGDLFDPDRFTFLEGRSSAGSRQVGERIEPPLVPDGTIHRVLDKLLILDGERISYRALDVEQIGSVYETMMGFRLEKATGRSVAIKPPKKQGAPALVDLDALLREAPAMRATRMEEYADRSFSDTIKNGLGAAATLEDLHATLLPAIDLSATPDLVPRHAMVLQPSDERRRSSTHYTPRSLTKPIVEMALAPVLARLSGVESPLPTPEQILDLKICDPAMGSGAFLVETCRQLGDALGEAWKTHGGRPTIPPDEDEVIFARRLVAQRCLYGVDKNPMAVDLAKVSLWLVTLAKDHALTFIDHALRHGDSLVGLSRRQIEAFHWDGAAPIFQAGLETMQVREHLAHVSELRQQIREADESAPDWELRNLWGHAQFELGKVRLFGDLVLAAYFEEEKPKGREQKRTEYAKAIMNGTAEQYRGWLDELRDIDKPLVPFHWEIEFPEVFERENAGFDSIVGNPPFLGGTRISHLLGHRYLTFLIHSISRTTGNVDLAGFFLRCSDSLIRLGGTLGLISTNSIKAGDSGRASLSLLIASRRKLLTKLEERQWPVASANVAYMPVCLQKLQTELGEVLTPRPLGQNRETCNRGCDVFGSGFVLSEQEKAKIVANDPASSRVIQPYIGGEEFNNSPSLQPSRFIINFGEMTREEAERFGPAFRRVEQLVRPARSAVRQADRRELWWLYATRAPAVTRFFDAHERVLAIGQMSKHLAFAFLPKGLVFSNALLLFLDDSYAFFNTLQSRVHSEWAVRWAGSMRRDVRYTSTDCFETFPFPKHWSTNSILEATGKTYYEFRVALMAQNNEGLTQTYNRFHDPDERNPEILKLRELHAAMDRAVLDAYGWTDIPTDCEFLLDYEIDEEEWGKRKKPYRYRWPDEVRDEVLARLLELNAQRAHEEARAGLKAGKKSAKKAGSKRAAKSSDIGDLFS